jgi:hypothetical protein
MTCGHCKGMLVRIGRSNLVRCSGCSKILFKDFNDEKRKNCTAN